MLEGCLGRIVRSALWFFICFICKEISKANGNYRASARFKLNSKERARRDTIGVLGIPVEHTTRTAVQLSSPEPEFDSNSHSFPGPDASEQHPPAF